MKSKNIKYKHSPCINFCKEDVSKFMKIIQNEFYSNMNIIEEEPSGNNICQNIDEKRERLYFLKYERYMKQEFNSTIVNMIVIYMEKINSFPEQYKNEPTFIYKMINLIKRY